MAWIEPENPTSDDPVTIWVVNASCAVTTMEKPVGSHFYFTIEYPDEPGPCIGPVPIPFQVGRLREGDYQVTHTNLDEDPVTQTFTVTQGELPFPLPIPSLGIPATILLAVALAWMANKAFKRMPKRTA